MRFYSACLYCGAELKGRADKKFCDPQCKSAHQYQQAKQNPERFYNKVDNQLKLNRRLLKNFNKAGKATIRKEQLLQAGFDPNFFTHYWKNNKGDVYLFVYEYGFLKKTENNTDKYILVQWQDYMN
ncbi:hypothetical protein KO566_10510 [Flavobacteriaceae bacterium XHP0103]|uniref:hypothetical protein n=1 Tax=Marixanthotalea marina TaxID=2844359 RepID=UPI002989F60B|nr:hypothetical protein [Marixanthotalea marina]MBU3822495.1 hypothetical protein [Marixanthotalea marina]